MDAAFLAFAPRPAGARIFGAGRLRYQLVDEAVVPSKTVSDKQPDRAATPAPARRSWTCRWKRRLGAPRPRRR